MAEEPPPGVKSRHSCSLVNTLLMFGEVATRNWSRPRIPSWHRVWGWEGPLLHYHTIRSKSWQDLRHWCLTPIRSLRPIRCPHLFRSFGPLRGFGPLWCPSPIRTHWLPMCGSGSPFCPLPSNLGWAGLFQNMSLLPIRKSSGFQWLGSSCWLIGPRTHLKGRN